MASKEKRKPWTIHTFRDKKSRSGRDPRSLSQRQKRAEFKSVQKLVDFQFTRENGSASPKAQDCSKLPTPRPYHTPKPRCNLTDKFSIVVKKLAFDSTPLRFEFKSKIETLPREDPEIWESRGL